jgi:tmRNA-binding protein
MNISPYKFASFIDKIDPKRERKLFLHRKDIIFLESKIKEK